MWLEQPDVVGTNSPLAVLYLIIFIIIWKDNWKAWLGELYLRNSPL